MYSSQELEDVDFNLVKKYLKIDSQNRLITSAVIVRDSAEISNVGGILKAWVKLNSFDNNPLNSSYFKVNKLL